MKAFITLSSQHRKQKRIPDNSLKSGNRWHKGGSLLLALVLWEVAARMVKQSVLLAGPLAVLRAIATIVTDKAFLVIVLHSMGAVMTGFLLALTVGVVLAVCSHKIPHFETFLWPYMSVIKATPVASFIVLCLVWFPVGKLSVIVSFFMVLPVVYTNVYSGIRSIDQKSLEMAKVYHVTGSRFLFGIVMPQMKPYLNAVIEIGTAMAVKSAIAAEVIGTPNQTIGQMLYEAKIYLSTSELMAWTVLIIVESVILEKILTVFFILLTNKMTEGILS